MNATQIFEQLSPEIPSLKVGGIEITDVDYDKDVKIGLSVKEIIKAAKKASKKNLISYPDNVSIY